MEYLGARGTLIHEKKLISKILCQTPLKFNFRNIFETAGLFLKQCLSNNLNFVHLSIINLEKTQNQ